MQLGDNLRLQAQAFLALRQYPEAEARINATLEIYRAASGPQYVNYPTALMVQGMILSQTGRTAEAETLLREGVRIRAENVPETHFLRATASGALGEFLTTQNRFSEAESFLLASYESLRKSQAENSPRTRLALERLAVLYENWGKIDAAHEYRSKLADH
jgi:tetratricopeptide (TPR) repeat protein